MILTIVLLTITVYLIVSYISNLKSCYNHFNRRNLPGPSPVPFFGHYCTLWSVSDLSEQLRRWTQQYGSIYGLFEGTRPMYVVSDMNFLHEVFVKQFGSFNARSIPFLMKEVERHQVHMFGAGGATWRRQRNIINPTFSAAKLRLMSSLVNHCVQSLLDKLKTMEEKEEQFNIYVMYRRLTMDVICRCIFGMNTDMQNNIDDVFMQKCKLAVDDNPERLFWNKLGNLIPALIPIVPYIMIVQTFLSEIIQNIAPKWFLPQFKGVPAIWILNRVETIVNARKQANRNGEHHFVDLLQLMLDAATCDDIKDDSNDQSIPLKRLHEKEVGANMLLFMIAGYDSVSTALASCTYVLATRADIQEKVRLEIDKQEWSDDDQQNYDTVMNMTYIHMFVQEVLRMYPIATAAIKRECTMKTNICGYEIEKGSVIQPDVLSIHYDRDLWGPEDPNVCIPERHQVKRHPMAYMPFGAGPRNCVGMRFAFMEIKMCLSQLLRRYIVLPGENIEEGFTHRETFLIQPDAVYIKLKKR